MSVFYMKIAVVVGGWHFPGDFYRRMPESLPGADYYCVSHRDPNLPIVRQEKRDLRSKLTGPLVDLDCVMYSVMPSWGVLQLWGWEYGEHPNTIGDWGFFNQWLARYDYRKYDLILNCHDDNYLRFDSGTLADALKLFDGDWLLLANGRYPEAPEGYVRGSFEFWRPELLHMLGGRIPLGDVKMMRIGQTDTPEGMDALAAWNATCDPLRKFMVERGLADRIHYLSPYYRISPWVIEGERGLLSNQGGAPWSFEAGLRAYPLEVAA